MSKERDAENGKSDAASQISETSQGEGDESMESI